MMKPLIAGASVALALFACSALADDALKSGPQVGSNDITPFNPLHINGPGAGGKSCLV
jgi:hypothetical protein